jgi:formate dehydrogenase iron-sulfur subunit
MVTAAVTAQERRAPIRSDRLTVVSVDEALRDQRALSAVERFARWHDAEPAPAATTSPSTSPSRYQGLLPAAAPAPGQQYAFEVDLDRCTGCKACVTGCHNLNGLEADEVWRTVGMLHGGTPEAPSRQTVTTACHHCLEPACLIGCPVKAYEKDPITGIVRHLDDQCIGCQYCVLMCPYDAPKFSEARGIVRKCDMCSDRLAHGEAPACVQACPNEAIRITVVAEGDVVAAAESGAFLSGAPAASVTLPTTLYTSKRPLPRNMLPADQDDLRPGAAHTPLALMLVLMQLAVGALALDRLLGGEDRLVTSGFALVVALAALGASTAHLGRPLLAFRALLGLATSWLSREVLAFLLFVAAAGIYAGRAADRGAAAGAGLGRGAEAPGLAGGGAGGGRRVLLVDGIRSDPP